MKDLEQIESEIVDLGQASVETRGNAIFQSDGGGGRLIFVPGMTDD